LRTNRRTNPIGPSNASAAASPPKRSFQAQIASNPNSWSQSSPAAVAITISSKIAHPKHCAMLSTVATYEPRCPSGAR
jgi:hypothetical protein